MSTTTPMSLKKGLTLSILYTLIVFLNGGVILMVAIWKFVNYYDR